MLELLKLWRTWVIAAIGVLLFALPSKAEQRQLYIRVELCKGNYCIERHLPVAPDTNEVQCIYGSWSTVATWVMQNMPLYKAKHWKCTYEKREES